MSSYDRMLEERCPKCGSDDTVDVIPKSGPFAGANIATCNACGHQVLYGSDETNSQDDDLSDWREHLG